MYPVSQDFLDALASPSLRTRLTGTLTLNTGAKIALSDASFLDGSVTVSNQCSEGSDIKLGGVYVGECDFTLLKPAFERALLKDASISLSAGLLVAGAWVDVPVGVWTVSTAKWSRIGVAVTAYDAMSLMDVNCSAAAAQATPFELIQRACTACKVTLADSASYIASLPNGGYEYTLAADSDIETWRDWLSWVVQLLGGFATINREGKLHISTYATGDPVFESAATLRTNDSTFEDYASRTTGMSVVWAKDQTTRYHHVSPDDGLTYNLGTNPFLQSKISSTDVVVQALIEAFALVSSTPMEMTMPGPPIWDLGDLLANPGGLGAGTQSNVMGVTWTPHQGVKLTAYGSDQNLASAKSKTDKDLAGLLSQMDANTVVQTPFANQGDADCEDGGGAQTLVAVQFAAKKDTVAVIHADIDLATTGTVSIEEGSTTWHPTIVQITYQLDETLLDRMTVLTLLDGGHAAHVMVTTDVDATTAHRLTMFISSSGGSVHVEAGGVHGLVEGVGLASSVAWDGTISLTDAWTPVGFTRSLTPETFTDTVDAAAQVPMPIGFSEQVESVPFTRSLSLTAWVGELTPTAFDQIDVTTLNQCTVDSGSITAANNRLNASGDSQLTGWPMGRDVFTTGISKVFINNVDGGVTMLVSFDAGATWTAWDGVTWTESATGMDAATVTSVTDFTPYSPTAGIMLRLLMPDGSSVQSAGADYQTIKQPQEEES